MGILRTLSLTKLTGLFIAIVIISKIVANGDWKNDQSIIGGDVRGYYAYLPALFINNDLKFQDLEVYKMTRPGYQVWTKQTKDGTRFIKYTCGMAIMYSPFFFIADALASNLGAAPDGFSWPYRIALIVASIFYLLVGLIFLSKFLLRFFSEYSVSIALIVLFLGTNLYNYETKHLTYSHGYSFALISLFLYAALSWFESFRIRWAIWMGVSFGLMVLIRPIDIIFISFVILYGVTTIVDFKSRLRLLWKYKLHIAVFMLLSFLMVLPQLLYFNYISGNFLFYSYNDESFFFGNPHLYDTLFSFRNGWLIYSPILILAIIGLFFIRKKSNALFSFTIITSITYFYTIASWWCWWYVGFGNRAFINLYPILAIGLCTFIELVNKKGIAIRWALNSIIIGLITLNAFQSYQFENNIIHWGYMSKEAYIDAWGRTQPSQTQQMFLHVPDLEAAKKGENLVSVPNIKILKHIKNNFETDSNTDSLLLLNVQNNDSYSGNRALYYPKMSEYIANTTFTVPENSTHVHISFKVKREDKILAVVEGVDHPFYFLSSEIVTLENDWEQVELFAKLPKDNKVKQLMFYAWNKCLLPVCIDDLEIKLVNFTYNDLEY
jgi:hypothetical protein